MTQVKILLGSNILILEEQTNAFLRSKLMRVLDIKFSEKDNGISVMIIYESL